MVTPETDITQNLLISNIHHQKRKSKSTLDKEVGLAKQKKTNQKKVTNKEETEHKIKLWILKEKSENKKDNQLIDAKDKSKQ